MSELKPLPEQRQNKFEAAEKKLHFDAEVYTLGAHFENLPPNLANIVILDVTHGPGCHYGLRNVFVPIIHHMEEKGVIVDDQRVAVTPETTIMVEPSTGNGWVAFSDAAHELEYEHVAIMPAGLPEARYHHPQGRPITIIKTPAKDYAEGMPKELRRLLHENPDRLIRGDKIYATPNHPVSAADITVSTMAELGKQLLRQIEGNTSPLRVVCSMGNGASLCALGEHVKEQVPGSKVVATETLAYGGGYDQFAVMKNLPRYSELFGIDPGNLIMMETFKTYGTNAPIGIDLPLQTRAMRGDLINDYILVTESEVMKVFAELASSQVHMEQALRLPNYSKLPQALYYVYGDSTLANIATAAQYADRGELVVAMAYDGRGNYK